MPKKPPSRTESIAPRDAPRRFLELYYPIHYQAGIRVEDAMRGGELSRHQVAILWLIHAQGDDGGRRMKRKDVERALGSWFEISGAAITKAVRSMCQPPHALVTLEEDPHSGREKVIVLTTAGVEFLAGMMRRAETFIARITAHMTPAEIVAGLHFFERIKAIVAELE